MRIAGVRRGLRASLPGALLIVVLLAGPVSAAPGDPDGAFGTGGIASVDLGFSDFSDAVAIGPDGSIVVGGHVFDGNFDQNDFAIAVLTATGAPKTSFSGDGERIVDLFGDDDRIFGLAVQPDGKIVAAGWSTKDGVSGFGLIRLKPNGTLDLAFGGGDGKVHTAFPQGDAYAYSVVLQGNGKIVVGGEVLLGTSGPAGGGGANSDFAVARYLANGTLDTAWSGDGRATTSFGTGSDRIYDLAIGSNGKPVAVGHTWDGADYRTAVVRFKTNGTLDGSFSGDGRRTVDLLATGLDAGVAVQVRSTGRILLASRAFDGIEHFVGLVQLLAGGAFDTSFGGGGKVLDQWDGIGVAVEDMALHAGKAVVVGLDLGSAPDRAVVCRYRSNGADDGFGTAGCAAIDFSDAAYARAVEVQDDGRPVVAAHWLADPPSNHDVAAVRLLA